MKFIKLFLVLQFLAAAFATGNSRYNNRVFRPFNIRPRQPPHHIHKETRQTNGCSSSMCEDDPFYPEDDIKRILDQHKSLHSFFKGRVIDPVEGPFISSRNDEDISTFCKTRDVVSAPKMMLDVNNVRRRIVNLKDYTQILKYQICDTKEGQECFKETLLNIKTKCVQKFSNIKLVTVDVDQGNLEYRPFSIPTTCLCTYTKENF